MMRVKRVSKRKLAANAAGVVVGLSLAAAGLLRAAEAPAEHCAMGQRRAETGCVEQGNTGSFEVERLELPTTDSCAERLRLWLWNLPQVVRALVLLPAWCIGESAVWTFRLIGAGLSPIWSMLGSVLMEALLLFGLFALLYKLLFPHAKLGMLFQKKTSVYKGYKQDKIEMRGDRAEMSDFPLYLNTVAGGLDRRDQTIGGFSFVVKIYAVPVVEIIG